MERVVDGQRAGDHGAREGRVVNLRNYQAYSMAEALAAVKRDLGADAVILRTRSWKRGGFLGIGRRTVFEITATPAAEAPAASSESNRPPRTATTRSRATAGPSRQALAAYQQAGAADPATDREKTRRLAQAILAERRSAEAAPSASELEAEQLNALLRRAAKRVPAKSSDVLTETGDIQARPEALGAGVVTAEANRRAAGAAGSDVTTPASSGGAAVAVEERPARSNATVSERHATSEPETPATETMPSAAQRFVLQPSAPLEGRGDDRGPSDEAEAVARAASAPREPEAAASEQSETEAPVDVNDTPVATPAGAGADSTSLSSTGPIEEELAAIRSMVGEVMRRQTTAPSGRQVPTMPQPLFDWYVRLIGQDVSEELADRVMTQVRQDLGDDQLGDPRRVRRAIRTRLAEFIPTAREPVPMRSPDGRPLTIAMVGPTGVGKTTTLAKVAATFKLRHNRRVGLITADTYRIAAVEQLRTYANIIGLSLEVVQTPDEMRHAVHALSDNDVILIDTAGRSQRDVSRITELQSFIRAADPHEVHLVLSGTAGEKVLLQEAEAFSAVGVDKVVLSKLDEAVSFGVLVDVIHRLGTELSFFTTGQEVPDHIEPGASDRLADLVLGGAL